MKCDIKFNQSIFYICVWIRSLIQRMKEFERERRLLKREQRKKLKEASQPIYEWGQYTFRQKHNCWKKKNLYMNFR